MEQRHFEDVSSEKAYDGLSPQNRETADLSVTVRELVDKYFEVKTDLKPTSVEVSKNKAKVWILPYFGDTRVCELNRSMVNEWFDMLKRYLGVLTVRGILNLFRGIMDMAVEYYGFEDNLVRKMQLKVKHKQKKPFEVWTVEDFNAFIEKVGDPHYHLFYNVLFYTGMRLGEIIGLQFQDIDLETGEVTINKNLQKVGNDYIYLDPKTEESDRTVFLSDEILEEYKEYLGLVNVGNICEKEGRIFFLTPYKYRSYLKKVCKRNGLRPINLHGFRHSLATELVSQGLPINYVSKWLGHASVSTTMNFYTHDNKKGNKEILACLNRSEE